MTLADRVTWPDLRIGLRLFPWHWHLHWYAEHQPAEPAYAGTLGFKLACGPLEVSFWANLPAFTEGDQ